MTKKLTHFNHRKEKTIFPTHGRKSPSPPVAPPPSSTFQHHNHSNTQKQANSLAIEQYKHPHLYQITSNTLKNAQKRPYFVFKPHQTILCTPETFSALFGVFLKEMKKERILALSLTVIYTRCCRSHLLKSQRNNR